MYLITTTAKETKTEIKISSLSIRQKLLKISGKSVIHLNVI